MNTSVGIGLMGLGNIGSEVYRVLSQRTSSLYEEAGSGISVRRILVRDTAKQRRVAPEPHLLTTEPAMLLDDPGIHLIVELLGCPGGDTGPSLCLIRRALLARKHVVTANKQVLAEHGPELSRLAKEKGVSLRFEAAVGGAIPIVKVLAESLRAGRVKSVHAVLNATTNYILTRMSAGRLSLGSALLEAQQLGYAESDPSSDLSGRDAAQKLLLLVALCSPYWVNPRDIATEGIDGITTSDVKYARQLGFSLKLLASCVFGQELPEIRVRPCLIPLSHPLSGVDGSTNAIVVNTDLAGEMLFMGAGAGSAPTSSAVVSDILDAVICLGNGSPGRAASHLSRSSAQASISKTTDSAAQHYLRVRTNLSCPGQVSRKLREAGIECTCRISRLIRCRGSGRETLEIILVTERITESRLEAALAVIARVAGICVSRRLRIETLTGREARPVPTGRAIQSVVRGTRVK